jgi:hypothetical protein
LDDLTSLKVKSLKGFKKFIPELNEIQVLKMMTMLIYILETKRKKENNSEIFDSMLSFTISIIFILIDYNIQNEIKFISAINLFLNFILKNENYLEKIKEVNSEFFDRLNHIPILNPQDMDGNLPEDLEMIGFSSLKSHVLSSFNLDSFEEIQSKRFFSLKSYLKEINQKQHDNDDVDDLLDLPTQQEQQQDEDELEDELEEEEDEVILFRPIEEYENGSAGVLNNPFQSSNHPFNNNLTDFMFQTPTAFESSTSLWTNTDKEETAISSDRIIKNPFKNEVSENIWSPFVSNQK